MEIVKHTDLFVKEMTRRGYSEETVKNYRSCAVKFFASSPKAHPAHINESDIRDFLSKFTEPNTQRAYHGAIKLFYKICMHQPDKFRYIPYCKKSRKLPIVLSQQEIQSLFDACENIKHKAIMAVLYGCGLRIGELIAMRPEHIDSGRMIVNVIQGKGKKDRQVMLPPVVLGLLRAYFRKYRPVGYLFNGQGSPQYSERSVNAFLKHYATKARIDGKRIYAHLLRHCSFTHLLEQGTDISLIQKIAGHGNIKTTQQYCHISSNLISKVVSPIQAITV